MSRVVLLFLVAFVAAGADLKSRIDALLSSAPALASAFAGIEVVSLASGKVLYAHNADHLFVPASNMKLFTSALALMRLGPQYQFVTQISSNVEMDGSGALDGDLVLAGGGDPSLSGREYPYQYHGAAARGAIYSFRAIEEFADQLAAKGLRQVNGDIIGDDRRYVWEPQVDGWSAGDALWEYGAPVSALVLNDNSFAITIRPGAQAGSPARIALTPNFEFLSVDNRVRTESAGERKIEINRGGGGRQLHISGVIPRGDSGTTELLAVTDPAQYAAEVLADALERRGVVIRGHPAARHRFSDEGSGTESEAEPRIVLAEKKSPPLVQLLQVTDKVSQNLHAEMMLREVGWMKKPPGTREAGLAEMQDFLAQAGLSKDAYRFSDGSGLSRATLVTPAAVIRLLTYMYRSNYREAWLNLLPIAGADGTLALRFQDHPKAQAIRAKTGSLGHVRAMSGYADSQEFGPLAFSILVNNFDAPAAEVNHVIDQIGLALVE